MGLPIQSIARVCHEINRSYCIALGEDNVPDVWDNLSNEQQALFSKGITFLIGRPDATPEIQHEAWMITRIQDGWVWGSVKDPVAKTHPCLVPYSQLPVAQRAKYSIFQTTVRQLLKV